MATMNLSLPDTMIAWIDECSRSGQYSDGSEYVRELIRRDQERTAKIARVQALIDEAGARREGRRSMQDIEAEALARLAAPQ
ncbi:antitoxin [Thiorhodovibrio winogradskyi]|nr:antitoxin [Thiorhodovibrio winogradskyi]